MKKKKRVEPKLNISSLGKLKELPATPTSVGEVMTTDVVTLSPRHTFQEAIGLMSNRLFRHFLVVEDNLRLVGVVSDRDLLRILSRTSAWQKTTVGEVMTMDAITVRPETPLSVAVMKMLKHRINCLPVVDGEKKMCGIVTSTDLLKIYMLQQACVERVVEVGLG